MKQEIQLPADYWEVLKVIKRALSAKFRFAYHTKEDISQEIDLMCLEAISKYDGIRPLENFLMSHCKKRLINLKRVYNRKVDLCKECRECRGGDLCGVCKPKVERAEAKKKSFDFVDIDSLDEDSEVLQYVSSVSIASISEIYQIIDEELPTDLRPFYLKLLHNTPISMYNKQRVFNSILKILEYYGVLMGENE